MTVLEVIQRSTNFLTKKGVDSPRLQAELLLAEVLGMPRMQLYLNFERVLTQAEEDRLRQMVKRRGEREPLQHIVGSTSFCGLEIQVSRAALIPRPETELLAEGGWTFLNQRVQRGSSEDRDPAVLDFGTGSGCIAIALAVKCPTARLVAVDVDPAAVELAKQNAAQNGVLERIEFVLGDRFAALEGGAGFELVISNPPYVPTAEIATLQPEVRDYDPHRALDGGGDGLDFYRYLAAHAKFVLKAKGKLMVEFGDGQAEALQKIFSNENWVVERIRSDYTQRPRILIARQTI